MMMRDNTEDSLSLEACSGKDLITPLSVEDLFLYLKYPRC